MSMNCFVPYFLVSLSCCCSRYSSTSEVPDIAVNVVEPEVGARWLVAPSIGGAESEEDVFPVRWQVAGSGTWRDESTWNISLHYNTTTQIAHSEVTNVLVPSTAYPQGVPGSPPQDVASYTWYYLIPRHVALRLPEEEEDVVYYLSICRATKSEKKLTDEDGTESEMNICGRSEVFGIAPHKQGALPPSNLGSIAFSEQSPDREAVVLEQYMSKLRQQAEEQLSKNAALDVDRVKLDSCTMVRTDSLTVFGNKIRQNEPIILTGAMHDWEALQSWSYDTFLETNVLRHGVQVRGLPHMTPMAQWVQFARCSRDSGEGVDVGVAARRCSRHLPDMPRVDMPGTDFFRYYPALATHLRFEHLLHAAGVDNYLRLVDDDLLSVTRVVMSPQRAGVGWQVNAFNASQLLAVTDGDLQVALYPPSTYHVPGALHNFYRQRDNQQSVPFYWWAYTRPALLSAALPLAECEVRKGDILYIPGGAWYTYLATGAAGSVGATHDLCAGRHGVAACLDELRAQADTAPLNYYGDIYMQLVEKLARRNDTLLEVAQRDFLPPRPLEGVPRAEFFAKVEDVGPLFYREDVDVVSSEVIAREQLPLAYDQLESSGSDGGTNYTPVSESEGSSVSKSDPSSLVSESDVSPVSEINASTVISETDTGASSVSESDSSPVSELEEKSAEHRQSGSSKNDERNSVRNEL